MNLEKIFTEMLEHIDEHKEAYKAWSNIEIVKTWILNSGLSDVINVKLIDCTIKEAPLEVDIIFQTKNGNFHIGKRFMPTLKSNKPIYQDFKKCRIRKNVIKWGLLP